MIDAVCAAACHPVEVRAGLVAAALLVAAPALAQTEGAKLDVWVKVCVQDAQAKRSLCRTGFDIVSEDGRVLVQAVLAENSQQKERTLTVSIPTGVQVAPGVQVQVDGGKAETARYGFCSPATCVAQAVIDDQLLAAMKGGTALAVTALGQTEQPVAYTLPLATFRAAHEGPSIDAAGVKARADELSRRSKDHIRAQFLKLLEEQKKARGE